MSLKIKQAIQVTVSLGIAIWIFWLLYRDIEFSSLKEQILSSNWFWILLSLGIAWVGYWIRGWRWSLLIRKDEGIKVSPNRAYHAVMVGYLVNMLVPRAGEVARCGVLSRSNNISLGHLLGTVILERSVDLLFLVSTIFLAFLLENQLFISLTNQLIDLNSLSLKLLQNLPMLIGALAVFVLLIYFIFQKFRNRGIINKLQSFFRQMVSGLKSIQSLENPLGFWASSIVIWIIYFLTMYTVSMGIQSTANLTPGEVLLVMVMGSIGMIAPVQGGIGTFHALVAYILIQLGVSESDGKIFAAIIHGTQVILVMVVGLISWIWMMRIPSWNKPDKD
ncbi:lysylphosphatidylglycerol synthase transmembrane domain-containing protein [Algoriphagus mannitolivorans]|uniref:lysylphosphatidylglycerol synthase transmembrane domain-containing protein n=1 Tax=Algoriphagus mannitolivorans TaxID=226504 RepID=UPI0004231193|nr:lysylphosphatidylglycerol synthase transmembrane domain-containing protein [Algoriphagus mannitolivorans]